MLITITSEMSGKKSKKEKESNEPEEPKKVKEPKKAKESKKAKKSADEPDAIDTLEPSPIQDVPVIVPQPAATQTITNATSPDANATRVLAAASASGASGASAPAAPIQVPTPTPKPIVKTVAKPAASPAAAKASSVKITVLFKGSSDDVTDDERSVPQTIVFVRGAFRDSNLTRSAVYAGRALNVLIDLLSAAYEYCKKKQPQCVQYGVSWSLVGRDAITVDNVAESFSPFMFDTLRFQAGNTMASPPTGSAFASAEDLVFSGSELGQDGIQLTLSGGVSVYATNWVINANGAFVGFNLVWSGAPQTYVVTDLDSSTYEMSSAIFATIDSKFPGIKSIDFSNSTPPGDNLSAKDKQPFFPFARQAVEVF